MLFKKSSWQLKILLQRQEFVPFLQVDWALATRSGPNPVTGLCSAGQFVPVTSAGGKAETSPLTPAQGARCSRQALYLVIQGDGVGGLVREGAGSAALAHAIPHPLSQG